MTQTLKILKTLKWLAENKDWLSNKNIKIKLKSPNSNKIQKHTMYNINSIFNDPLCKITVPTLNKCLNIY